MSTLTVHDHVEQGTDDWLKLRLGLVTASIVGKLITPAKIAVAKNDTSRGVIAQMVAERITGQIEPSYMNDDMMRGHMVEPIARDLYARTHDVEVVEVGFMVRDFGDYRLGFSPDGLVGDDGIIEVKAPRAKGHMLTHVSGNVPAHHMAQIQAGLLVSGRSWCDYISYAPGLPTFTKRVGVDQRWFTTIQDATYQAELAAAQMLAAYQAATDGMAATEPLPSLEIQIGA